jgi:hypothetical protein
MEDPPVDRRFHGSARSEARSARFEERKRNAAEGCEPTGLQSGLACDGLSRTSLRWIEDPDIGELRLLRADDRFWSSSRVCLLSSHRGRRGDLHPTWWDAFRDALLDVAESDRLVLTAAGTPADPWLRAAVNPLGIQLAELRLPRPGIGIEAWLREACVAQPVPQLPPPFVSVCEVSPPIREGQRSRRATSRTGKATADDRRDALLLSLAEEARVLFVRDRGRIADLLDHLAGRSDQSLSRVVLDAREELISSQRDSVWRSRGAVRRGATGGSLPGRLRELWRLPDHLKSIGNCPEQGGSSGWRSDGGVGEVRSWAEVCDEMEGFLSHWTRECPGPWPGQSDEEYLLEMMIDPNARRRSVLDSLLRMVREQRLRASHRLVRGDTPVVSFTARPLDAFAGLRRFQQHLGRWDFNPFGICLHREWLRQQGAKPVVYGDQRLWQRLAEEQRPFFQCSRVPASSQDPDALTIKPLQPGASSCAGHGDDRARPGDGGRRDDPSATTDWTLEEEWRHVGDMDLSLAPPEVVRVFVGDSESAQAIAAVSPWIVVNLDQATGIGTRTRASKRSPRV